MLRAKPSSPKIIYIDDPHGNARLLKDALDILGAHIDVDVLASDSALRYFILKAQIREAATPLCILIDWHVDLDGATELLQFIRSVTVYNEMPILVLSSEQERTSAAETLAVSPGSVVDKPIDWADFLTLGESLMRMSPAKHDPAVSRSPGSRHVFICA